MGRSHEKLTNRPIIWAVHADHALEIFLLQIVDQDKLVGRYYSVPVVVNRHSNLESDSGEDPIL